MGASQKPAQTSAQSEILRLRDEGMRRPAIAAHLGVDIHKVNSVLNTFGGHTAAGYGDGRIRLASIELARRTQDVHGPGALA